VAFVALARSDAFVAVFDAKYHYDFWRPIAAIRNGDIDDNPNTERDATWQPMDHTPMHPEYPRAHCIMSATIASVVEELFGTAGVPEVTLTSPTATGVMHSWMDRYVGADRRGVAGSHLVGLPLPVLNEGRSGHGAPYWPIRRQEHHAACRRFQRSLIASACWRLAGASPSKHQRRDDCCARLVVQD
jgi:hypothetical protein